MKVGSCVWLFVTPLPIQSMEFSRPEYWSGYPFPSPGDFPNPGIKPRSSALQADSLPAEPQGKPKNTGVGSLCLLQQIFPTQESNQGLLHCRRILYQLSYQGSLKFESESESPSVVSNSLRPHGLYSPWPSIGQNTGMGTLSLLQGIFPTQGWNPGLLHCRWILYQLSHKGSRRILEWVTYPFSSRSSWSRNWTGVSFIAGGFFTNWAIREALNDSNLAIGVSQVVLAVKNLPASAGDLRHVGSTPGLERSPREGHDIRLQYFCLENPLDRGAWWAI